MPFRDCTNDFQQILHDKERALPDAKRRKITKPTPTENKVVGKEYVAEAYTIVRTRRALDTEDEY